MLKGIGFQRPCEVINLNGTSNSFIGEGKKRSPK